MEKSIKKAQKKVKDADDKAKKDLAKTAKKEQVEPVDSFDS